MRVCGSGPKSLHRGGGGGLARQAWRHGLHGCGERLGCCGPGAADVRPPTAGSASVSTGCTTVSTHWSSSTTFPSRRSPIGKLPCCYVVPRTGSLSGRRVLLAQPPVGALRQTLKGTRRRLDDRASHRGNQSGRCVGLHSHQCHLHNRRADLPGDRPVLFGGPSRHQRRHLGFPGGWRRPVGSHEEGGRSHPDQPCPVPGTRGVRPVRLRTRLPPRRPSWREAPGWWRCSSSPSSVPLPWRTR